MTRKELELTEWAINFKKESICYEEAIELALNTELEVEIYRSDDGWGKDSNYVIAVAKPMHISQEYKFWLDAYKTKEEAMKLCKEMGWRVKL